MKTVGVRELKNRTTQIVRDVREESQEYIITLDGKPVAIIRPYSEEDSQAQREADWAEWMEELEAIAEEVSKVWPEGVSAVDAVREQRRWATGDE